MKSLRLIAPLSIVLMACLASAAEDLKLPPGAHVVHRKPISLAQQKALLASTASNPGGTFDSFCSLLFAAADVAIHTHDKFVNKTILNPVFPESYKPTYKQLFETIARQTRSTMHYDPKNDFWVFDPPEMPLPYSLSIAPGWQDEDNGLFVKYVPPLQPVGMDVYMLGTYPTSDIALTHKIRDELAVQFASHFDSSITANKMTVQKVSGTDALYFESPAPKPGVTWRQWSLVDHGQAIVIVSSLDKINEDVLLPQVKQMVASLKVSAMQKQ